MKRAAAATVVPLPPAKRYCVRSLCASVAAEMYATPLVPPVTDALMANLRRKTWGAFDRVLARHRADSYVLFTLSALVPELPTAEGHLDAVFARTVVAANQALLVNAGAAGAAAPIAWPRLTLAAGDTAASLRRIHNMLIWLERWHAAMIAYAHATQRPLEPIVALFAALSQRMLAEMDEVAVCL